MYTPSNTENAFALEKSLQDNKIRIENCQHHTPAIRIRPMYIHVYICNTVCTVSFE